MDFRIREGDAWKVQVCALADAYPLATFLSLAARHIVI